MALTAFFLNFFLWFSNDENGSTDRLSVNSQPVSRSGLSVPPLPFSPSASSLLAAGTGSQAVQGHHVSKAALLRGNHPLSLLSERGTPAGNSSSSVSGGSVHVPPLPR